jgi:molecular chaperone GrpE
VTEQHFPAEGHVEFEVDATPETDHVSASGEAPTQEQGVADSGDGMQAKLDELTSDLQRLQAEYVNYKRRVDRDRDLVMENAKFSVLSALLPVLDDLDRARDHGELEGGSKAIADNLERIVAGAGLQRFGLAGDEFDPQIHEALMHGLSADVTTTTCDKIVQTGYRIGERVVRPAMVTVVDPDPAGTPANPVPPVNPGPSR